MAKHDRNKRSEHVESRILVDRASNWPVIWIKKGVVHSAGTYLQASPKKAKLQSGLGARHAAGLGITMATDAVATVVSSSSGTITIFHDGETILEPERVQSGE